MASRFALADCLSKLESYDEAIGLRRLELTWCCSTNESDDPDTFWSMRKLAADLSAVGAIEEAEALLREALAGFERVLDPSHFVIGEMLSDIASLLDERGNRAEALAFGERAIQHLQQHEGSDNCYTHVGRLVQARRLINDDRKAQAAALLDAVQSSLKAKKDLGDDDQALLQKARELRQEMDERQPSEPEPPAQRSKRQRLMAWLLRWLRR